MHIQMDFFKELHIQGQSSTQAGKFPQAYGPLFTDSYVCLQQHFQQHSEQIVKLVHKYGAVLFRGYDIKSPNQAVSVLNKLGLKSFEYLGGAAVRKLIIGSEEKSKINKKTIEMFTTNEAPPNQPIPFHNQLLQNQNYPEFISFYCASQPETGGATPIVSGHQLYKFLMKCHNHFLIKLEELGVKYTRVVGQHDNPNSPIGRGWRNIFNVKSKQQAQLKMKQAKYEFEWMNNEDNDCRLTSQKLQAVIDSKSGIRTFCNQILAVYQGWKDNKNSPENCLKFGDGSDMPQDMLKYLYQHAENIKVSIPWKKGDFIILDNQLAMHSRQPFTGPHRRVYASLFKGKTEKSLQPCQILNSGYQMPLIGFGTWKIPKKQCSEVVYQAIKTGYRLLDCACDYGNQEQVGEGIIKAMDAKIVERKDLFITSKLWNTYHHPQHVRAACLKTLKDLKLDYLDLYLIHFPISLKFVPFEKRYPPEWRYDPNSQKPYMIEEPVQIIDTWRAMQELVKEGLVRNIGISNFKVTLIRELLYGCSIKPSVLQVQLHPQLTQKKLIRYCRQNGIQITSYSTFGATSYVQLGGATSDQALTKHDLIIQLSKKYQKSPHQIILRWAHQLGLAIIPKSSNLQRMKQNFHITNFTLDAQDMISIDELNKNRRYNDPGVFCQIAFGTFFPIHD